MSLVFDRDPLLHLCLLVFLLDLFSILLRSLWIPSVALLVCQQDVCACRRGVLVHTLDISVALHILSLRLFSSQCFPLLSMSSHDTLFPSLDFSAWSVIRFFFEVFCVLQSLSHCPLF